MKKAFTLAALGLAAVLSFGGAALAQDSKLANVPFDFTVGDAHFAAGTYYVQQVGESLILRSADGKHSAMFRTVHADHGKMADRNLLEFRNEAGQHALLSVKTAGSSDAAELPGITRTASAQTILAGAGN